LSKRKKRTSQQPHPPSHTFFSLPAVRLLQEALRTFERTLLQQPAALSNVTLAKQVVGGLKPKLEELLQREDWELEIPLDGIEIQFLWTGMQMYLLELMGSGQQERLLPCFALCQQFRQLVEHIDQAQGRGF